MRTPASSVVSVAVLGALLRVPSGRSLPLPQPLISLNSSEGFELLMSDTTLLAGFDGMTSHIVTQTDESSCSRASATVVLNSLSAFGVEAPVDATYSPYNYWTQEDFVASTCVATNCTSPCTLDQATRAISCVDGVIGTASHAATDLVDVGALRTLLAETFQDPLRRMIANFDRTGAGQVGGGHFSPIAAFDPTTDRALVLDVARYKYPPAWFPVTTLWDAIHTMDMTAQKDRGILVVTAKNLTDKGR